MKIEEVAIYSNSPIRQQFESGMRSIEEDSITCFEFCRNLVYHGIEVDILVAGTDSGRVTYFKIPSRMVDGASHHYTASKDVSKDKNNFHEGPVQCLLHLREFYAISSLTHSLGILMTGGRDHSIRVWNIALKEKPLMQILHGHNGSIMQLCNGNDNSIISLCSSGVIKIWTVHSDPFNVLCNPFMQCSFTLINDIEVLPTSLCVGAFGIWTAFVGDEIGNVILYRKAHTYQDNLSNKLKNSSLHELKQLRIWRKIHSLQVTRLELILDEDILVTLSNDTTCKFIDARTGKIQFDIKNKRNFRYTSLVWISSRNYVLLSDEIGYLDIVSVQNEFLEESVLLGQPSSALSSVISKSHRFSMLSNLILGKYDNLFYMLSKFDISKCAPLASERCCIYLCRFHRDPTCSIIKGCSYKMSKNQIPIDDSIQFLFPFEENVWINERIKTRKINSFCSEESAIVTISNHHVTILDEFDKKELFQHHIHNKSSIVMAKVLWPWNVVIVCYENGYVDVIEFDSGYVIKSQVSKNAINCLTIAKAGNTSFLLGSDEITGKLIYWNLSLFEHDRNAFVCDSVRQSFHDATNPGVLSMAFHFQTETIFSGGVDFSIRYWKCKLTQNNQFHGVINRHIDSVCVLQVQDDFLLSGCESGDIFLWRILYHETKTIESLEKYWNWSCFVNGNDIALRASAQFSQRNETEFSVLQCLEKEILVWNVSLNNKKASTNIEVNIIESNINLIADDSSIRKEIIKNEPANVINSKINVEEYTNISFDKKVIASYYGLFQSDNKLHVFLGFEDGSIVKYTI